MSSPTPPARPRAIVQSAARLVKDLFQRAYAVGVIALVGWLSFLALRYLVVTLMLPTASPAQIVGLPTRYTQAVLRSPRSQWPGVEVSESPRTPLAHYHRLDGWIQPDPFNGCTRSGCHAPLPHARRKEVRAFLNMHATSLHCSVCHMQSPDQPLHTTWYDLTTGRTRGAPTVLEICAWLASPAGQQEFATPGPAQQSRLVTLLRRAAREADGDPTLIKLADDLNAVSATSELFAHLVATARDILPQHFRGEYGAKLALRDDRSGAPLLNHPGTTDTIRDFLATAGDLRPEQRQTWVPRLHPARRLEALHCTNCHRDQQALIDFASAGYPEARRISLFRAPLFQTIEHIADGRPLYLPQFTEPGRPGP